MIIAAVGNPQLYEERSARRLAVQIRENGCETIVFYGRLFKFAHAIDIDLIKLFQEILEAFADARRLIFADCCLFLPSATCIFVPGDRFEEFALTDTGLAYRGRELPPGIHNGDAYVPFSDFPERVIHLSNNDVGALPDVRESCRIHLQFRDCDQFALDFARQKYGEIARFTDLALRTECSVREPEWCLELLQWKDVFCHRGGLIDFAAAGPVISVIGENASGKSSLIRIALLGIFAAGKKQAVIRRGSTHGHIRCVLRRAAVTYTIDTVITAKGFTRTVTPAGADLSFLQPQKELYSLRGTALPAEYWDVARANGLLRAICRISICVRGGSIKIQDQSLVALNECSAGQRALIELALCLTATCSRSQVLFIDELLDRLDAAHFAAFLEHAQQFYDQLLIIGHRRELLDFSEAHVIRGGELIIGNRRGSKDIAFGCECSSSCTRTCNSHCTVGIRD